MTAPLTLYGVKISMFTGKVRSYLIKQGIHFTEVAPVSEQFTNVVLPQIGRRIIPVIEMPDGTIVQDTTDIIDYLEGQSLSAESAYPTDPLRHLLALILELFGDEGLLRPAMHYRWNFPQDTSGFITHGFGGWQGPDATDEAKAQIKKTMKTFSGFLPALGVTPETIPEVERSFDALMDILEAHFIRTPYLFGAAPTIGDYGMMCSLYAHLARDPVPSGLMKNLAPSLFRWTERMNVPHADYSDMPYYAPSHDLPETLSPLFKYIADYFLPEMQMNVDVMNALPGGTSGDPATMNPKMAVLGFGSFQHGEATIQCAVRPIRLYMLQRVTDYFAGMKKDDQKAVLYYLEPLGLTPLLTLTAKHRVARKNHIEVWE
ncbi:glutathione S-transferase family protein [Hellea balneolensis]|uniref:glutathione S-transferase family protein n=1 Tax=Hellea balneolensis TaxID=287478 RepID=UPI000403E1CB|nr:glutathione S-transferase family protein [Hellea balneolensis]